MKNYEVNIKEAEYLAGQKKYLKAVESLKAQVLALPPYEDKRNTDIITELVKDIDIILEYISAESLTNGKDEYGLILFRILEVSSWFEWTYHEPMFKIFDANGLRAV